MAALIACIVVAAMMAWAVLYQAKHRPPGSPLTWGEAFVAGLFIFVFMLLIYGILPSQWLTYADSTLKWRSDKVGIPVGPLHYLPGWPKPQGKVLFFIPTAKNLLWPKGITFMGRGKITFTAVILRDIIATVIYGAGLVGQARVWKWWQNRGKRKVAIPELTSAYGRPLVRKV